MKRYRLSPGLGVLLLIFVLGLPGLAGAELGSGLFWDLLVSIALDETSPAPGSSGSGGGEGNNGGGAMDPNGGGGTGDPKPKP